MEVAFVNRMLGLHRGGGEIWDLRMAEHLRDLGVDVTFYLGKPRGSELTHPPWDFDYVEVDTPHLQDLAYSMPAGVGGALADLDAHFFTRRAVDRLKGADFDVVHVNSRPHFARYADGFGQPVVIKMNAPPYSLWYDVVNPFTSSYRLLEEFDRVIATGVTVEEIRQRSSCDVTMINPGVDTEVFTPGASEDAAGTKNLLFVGRFVPSKNIGLLLEAFDYVHQFHDAELTLVGDGPLRQKVERKSSKLGLGDSVEFVGHVENQSLPSYYCDADVFVLSSKNDNHPITILEAMSCGTAVVAPRVGWIPELVDDGVDGLLYQQGSKEGLVEALGSLLEEAELRQVLGANGRRKAVSDFDWNDKAVNLKETYEDLLNSRE